MRKELVQGVPKGFFCQEASTFATAFYSRPTIEAVLEWMYDHDTDLEAPYQRTLSNLLQQRELRDLPVIA